MSSPKDVPPQAVHVAEQAFAEANHALDDIIGILRKGMDEHPEYENSPSLLWYRSVIDYKDKAQEYLANPIVNALVHFHTAELMIAAIFRLATQEPRLDPLGDLNA